MLFLSGESGVHSRGGRTGKCREGKEVNREKNSLELDNFRLRGKLVRNEQVTINWGNPREKEEGRSLFAERPRRRG